MSCWSAEPNPLHNAHLTITLENHDILARIARRRLSGAAVVSGLCDGLQLQVIDADGPRSALAELARRQDPLGNQSPDRRLAHVEHVGRLVQRCLATFRSLPLAIGRDLSMVA